MDFSFIIPVYNCRETLSACVQSILHAHICDSEILLIDDGSTDGSGQLCDALERRYSQIKVIHQANGGAAAARNAGLSACTGSRILFADADDTLDSAVLKTLLINDWHPNADLTIFGMEFRFFHHGRHIKSELSHYKSRGILSADTWGANLVDLFHANALSSLCNKIYNRDFIEDHHLRLDPELRVYEDLDFCLRYMSFCNKIRIIPEPVYRYHLPADNRKVHHRLVGLDTIPGCLEPIEASLSQLMEYKPDVSPRIGGQILESLHLMLLQQKMTGAGISGIRRMCSDYIEWEKRAVLFPSPSGFRSSVCSSAVYLLWLRHKVSACRHRMGTLCRWFFSFVPGGSDEY